MIAPEIRPRRTVAIMQPYFIPYAGYFRLLAATDLFVLYDCVQFIRRGWIHRNRLPTAAGALDWLTLPLEKGPQEMRISELRFRPGAPADLAVQMQRFPVLTRAVQHPLLAAMGDLSGSPLDYIERLLKLAAELLGLPWRTLRSSSLGVPPQIRGQDRVLAIAQTLGADCYLNAPGGRALYQPERFADAGIALRFLPDHEGSFASIAARLTEESAVSVTQEIMAGSRLLA